ncbi:YciI family protein [Caballeronia sp. SEWSISQ10-4 2]|uniref:YciI family protein n=1 Tax=Caballeronia sp. SEWSISQ10-4 2 TaxID=2937438 RepID=UPI002656CE2B|nr:YciI family protein [Caballeronia sp. SEWSISQ10-4 2]MDN7183415.1 YciI family protein [Caballeronia sp. SEWSISQ10-4 2]
MSYLLLIAEPVGQRAERSQAEGKLLYERMVEFGAELKERGLLIASESLATGGVRIKKRDGQTSMIDGPYAEAKEMIGGFYMLDCATKEQAIEIATACPAAEWCEVEVRKVGPCWE